jgi:hypothetical protein
MMQLSNKDLVIKKLNTEVKTLKSDKVKPNKNENKQNQVKNIKKIK